MEKEQETMMPALQLIQVTHAGNVVILDPVTMRETFLVSNEAHDRFRHPNGKDYTAEEIVALVTERLEQRAAMEEEKKQKQQQQLSSEPPAADDDRQLFCTHCGARLIEGNSFCTECGARIGS